MKYLSIFFALCYPAWCSLQTISKIEISRLLRQADSVLLTSPSDALLFTDIALQSKSIKNDCTLKGTALNLKSRALRSTGRSEEALKILDQSIPFYRKCNNDTVLATGLATLALCFMDSMGGSDTSENVLNPLNEAAGLAQRLRDTMLLSKIYIYFAKNWGDNEQSEKALDYNLRCESLLKNSTDGKQRYLRGINRIGMGNQHLSLYYKNDSTDHLEQAAHSFLGALDDLKGLTHKEALGAIADAKNGLGGAKLYADDIPGAKENFEESLEIFRRLNDTVQAVNALYNLSILAESQNDFLAASDTLEVANRLAKDYKKDDLSDLMLYQLVGSSYEDRKLLLNSQYKAKKMERQYWILGLCSLLAVFLGILYWLKIRTRQRLQLREMENKLQQREISFVREKIDAETAERLRIARKLHDDVGGMLVSTKWNLEAIIEDVPEGSELAQKLADNLHQQEESYLAVREVSHQLKRSTGYWWEDLERFCQRIGNGHPKIQFYTFNLDDSVVGIIGEAARVTTQELIVNALKSAKATEINVQISRVDHVLSIFVRDDGIGFDTKTKSSGIGFANIRERIEQELGGSFSIDSTPGEGTSIFVDIPLGPSDAMDNNPLKFDDNDE